MDTATARTLSTLTSDFYARVSSSFSETRQHAWQGWERVTKETADAIRPGMRVLDLGCGNLRFERFLIGRIANSGAESEARAGSAGRAAASSEAVAHDKRAAANTSGRLLRAWAVDNCAPLVGGVDGARRKAGARGDLPAAAFVRSAHVDVRLVDLAEALLDDDPAALDAGIDAPPCDLAVAFGFMHHLPLPAQRTRALRALVRHARPGGFVAVSFWQFARSEKLLAKARTATAEGRAAHGLPPFETGDYLLGWQHERGVYRFCHHFEEREIDALVRDAMAEAPDVRETARFSADGKRGDLNRYLILQRV